MRVVEDSYYEHDEFGLVRVVNAHRDVVRMQLIGESKYVSGVGEIPIAEREEIPSFRERASPADMNVSADLSEAGMDSPSM